MTQVRVGSDDKQRGSIFSIVFFIDFGEVAFLRERAERVPGRALLVH